MTFTADLKLYTTERPTHVKYGSSLTYHSKVMSSGKDFFRETYQQRDTAKITCPRSFNAEGSIKTSLEKEKVLATSKFSFSHNVFKAFLFRIGKAWNCYCLPHDPDF